MVIHLSVALAALVGLVLASDLTVAGARALARRMRMSELVVGLTLASIGTSLPEIATNVAAATLATRGGEASGVAVGNVVGSCLSQITLLLGVCGAVAANLSIGRRDLLRDGSALIFVMIAMVIAAVDGVITGGEGVVLIAIYAVYLGWLWWSADRADPGPQVGSMGPLRAVVSTVVGLGLVVVCADLMVERVVVLARLAGVSDTTAGLLVGIGTGAPELSIALRALRSGAPSLSLGNLIGSNIVDPSLSIGVGALIHPVRVDPTVLWLDIPWWIAATIAALVSLRDRQSLQRSESVSLLLWFGLWVWVRFVFLGGG